MRSPHPASFLRKWKTKILVNDRIADSVFQQVLLRANEYQVFATPNLNGDYLSDACAAQVGGLGMAPGANIGDGYGVFEATHGTAPKYADKDVINPSSVMLSGAMMFDFLGWGEAARLIEDGIGKTILQKRVTYDLERLMPGARVIYETGWHRHFGQPDYFTDFPSLTQPAAAYLAGRCIRLLGMDTPTPSRDYYEVHHLLQQKPAEIVIVESLANLDMLPEDFLFIGFPLRFEGGDGSPIRAIAVIA